MSKRLNLTSKTLRFFQAAIASVLFLPQPAWSSIYVNTIQTLPGDSGFGQISPGPVQCSVPGELPTTYTVTGYGSSEKACSNAVYIAHNYYSNAVDLFRSSCSAVHGLPALLGGARCSPSGLNGTGGESQFGETCTYLWHDAFDKPAYEHQTSSTWQCACPQSIVPGSPS